ncbi:MAG: hypothetical protein QXY62_05115 [Candidatus Altiarchaeota archaeon]
MQIINKTKFHVEQVLRSYVATYPVENLLVKISYTKKNSSVQYSGVCYYKRDKIRVSINPKNFYPLKIKVGSPFDRSSWKFYKMNSAEELISFIFLHEISHYLDYKNGLSTKCKQTKADKFALWKMGKL